MRKVKQSRAALADVENVARFLINAYKAENGNDISYSNLEVMLFYVWWYCLSEDGYELFHADWELCYGYIVFADEQTENKIKALLADKGEFKLSRDAENALEFLCNTDGILKANMSNALECLVSDLRELGFKNLGLITADRLLNAKRSDSLIRGVVDFTLAAAFLLTTVFLLAFLLAN